MSLEAEKIKAAELKRWLADAGYAEDDDLLATTIEGECDLFQTFDSLIISAQSDEAFACAASLMAKQISDRVARLRDRAEAKRRAILNIMTDLELKKIERPIATLSVCAGKAKAVITDENLLPDKYFTTKVEKKVNKKLLNDDVASGIVVDGASRANPEPYLTVRGK